MEKVRAKFEVTSVSKDETYNQETIYAAAVYGGATNAEDNTFAAATPGGSLTLKVSNPDAFGFFKVGEKIYLDFTKAAE